MTNRTTDKELKKKIKAKIKEESIPSDTEELFQLFRIESNTNRLRGRGKGRGRGRGRSRGNGWTLPMQIYSDMDNGDSSDSIEHELNQNQRRSSRLSRLSRSTDENTILSSESGDDSRKSRNRRREKRGNQNLNQSVNPSVNQNMNQNQSMNVREENSSEEFEEESGRKRSIKQESSYVEDKRRRQSSLKEEGWNSMDKERWMGRTMREITAGHMEEEGGGGGGGDSMEEEESMNGNCPTIITKNNKTVTLPDLNPPPLAKISSLRVHIGCGLCTCRHTSDMVICNRCGDEFHASCLYGNEMDYNNWMCSECACVLSHLNEKYSYLKLDSEILIGNLAPMGYPNSRFVSMENTIEEKRLRWLLKMGDSLIGSRVWFHEVNVMGRILRRLDDLLLYYVTFDGLYWNEEGWYALEKNDIGILKDFVWIRKKDELHFGVKLEEVDNENDEALDLISNEMINGKESKFEKVNDWREHKYELFYTSILDTIRWEIHVKDRLTRYLEHPWKVLSNRSELNAKEWMYKWIYMWSREVDFPLGGWVRGVVLHYRSITGKHFVWFENDEVPSSWFYLNGQYIVVEGVNNE